MEGVRVILEAVNENNLELAQRTVDGEVRKNPNSDVFLSLKVFVASRRNDSRQALDTAERAVSVCSKKTLLMFLVTSLIPYNATELLSAAFVRVNRLDPTDSEITEGWLETSLLLGDLGLAQKALMAMQRTTKKPRSVCYQACFVMAMDNSNSKLFPVLANRMIQKYLPAKTLQECFVVAHVYRINSVDSMVKYLMEPEIHKSFVAGNLDLQLLLLSGLEETKQWELLYDYSQSQLKQIDSYCYWQALNAAAVELGKVGSTAEIAAQFVSSNALLSRVDLSSKAGDKEGVKIAIAEYWKKMGAKPSTYKYLKPLITGDNIDLVSPESSSLGMKINYAKFKSLVNDPLSISDLVKMYEDHLPEVPAEKTDYFIGTDALLMVAQSILRGDKLLHGFSREIAATVLEYSLGADPHNFYVRLLLIVLYQSLGVLNLAYKHFEALSIKNIQFETLGYLLSTRIGSISPDAAKPILMKLQRMRDQIPNFGVFGVASLTEGSFTQFDGIFKLGQKLRYSLSSSLVALESIRVARLMRGSVDFADLHAIPEPATRLIDNRDFSIAAFDDGGEEVINNLLAGPKQETEYVRIQKLKEIAYQSVTQGRTVPVVEGLSAAARKCHEMTEIEKWNIECIESIVNERKSASLKPPPAFDVANKSLDWQFFHWGFTILETVKVAKAMKCTVGFDGQAIVKTAAAQYQSQMNIWETKGSAAFRESSLPGDASKVLRAIKQEHMAKLKYLLEKI